jgi:hypothetical protein
MNRPGWRAGGEGEIVHDGHDKNESDVEGMGRRAIRESRMGIGSVVDQSGRCSSGSQAATV